MHDGGFALTLVSFSLPDEPVHILLLNEYFPPDTSATAKCAAQVAEALSVNHRVTVLAGRPSYDPAERHPRYLLRREVRGNLAVERVGSTAYPRFQMRRRVSNYLTYLSLAIPRALSIPSDIVLAMTDPPIEGIAGALVARLSGRPFVYNIRDMYPDMAVGGSIVRPGSFTARWEAMHRWALRQRGARDCSWRGHARSHRRERGRSGPRRSLPRRNTSFRKLLPSAENSVAREIRGDFRFVLVHAGNVGFYGAWQTLISAVRMLENEGVGLVFIGEGAMKPQVEAMAEGCRAIRFLPFRPASEVPLVLSSGDMHVVTVKRGLEGVVVPSKLYPTLAAGRPVLGVAPEESDVVRIIRRTGCGVAANPDDPASVAEAIRSVLHDSEQLQTMARRAREISFSYDRVKQLKIFSETLEDAVRQ